MELKKWKYDENYKIYYKIKIDNKKQKLNKNYNLAYKTQTRKN